MRSITLPPEQTARVNALIREAVENRNSESRDRIAQMCPRNQRLQGVLDALYAIGVIVDIHYQDDSTKSGPIVAWEII